MRLWQGDDEVHRLYTADMMTHKHTWQLQGKDAVPAFAAVKAAKSDIIFTTGIKTNGKRVLITV